MSQEGFDTAFTSLNPRYKAEATIVVGALTSAPMAFDIAYFSIAAILKLNPLTIAEISKP